MNAAVDPVFLDDIFTTEEDSEGFSPGKDILTLYTKP